MASIISSFKRSVLVETFVTLRKNWKLYGGLWLISVVVMLVVAGIPSPETAVTTFFSGMILWLATIFLTRFVKAGRKVGIRDALYSGMAPLVSSLVMLAMILVQSVPIMILIIAYSSAVETKLFENFGQGLGFFLFAVVMVAISMYLLPSGVMSLVAVSAPGLYPKEAFSNVSELMRGRRVKFWIAAAVLIMVLAVFWGVVMVPTVLILEQVEGVDVASVVGVVGAVLGSFSVLVAAVYGYLFYWKMINTGQ